MGAIVLCMAEHGVDHYLKPSQLKLKNAYVFGSARIFSSLETICQSVIPDEAA
jgi:hypothetical protein